MALVLSQLRTSKQVIYSSRFSVSSSELLGLSVITIKTSMERRTIIEVDI